MKRLYKQGCFIIRYSLPLTCKWNDVAFDLFEITSGSLSLLAETDSEKSSSPGEFHPQALTEPGVNLSAHRALHAPSPK